MDNFKKEAYKFRMTPDEKAAMKRQLFGMPSAVETTPSPYFMFNFQFMTRAVALVLVAVLVGGTGVAYAAQGSLPGSPLYAVKVDVEEPVQLALATTPAAKAQVNVAIAEKRVEEAETLASQGNLDATTTQELVANFDAHASDANVIAMQVATSDPATAVDIQAQLSSTLSVHSAILAALGQDASNTPTKENSDRFAARILEHLRHEGISSSATSSGEVVAVNDTGSTRTMSAFAVSPTVPATATTTTSQTASSSTSTLQETGGATASPSQENTEKNGEDAALGVHASAALSEAQSAYVNVKQTLDASTTAELDQQFAQVAELEASGEYTQALDLALKLQTILQAQQNYRADITAPLLNINPNNVLNLRDR